MDIQSSRLNDDKASSTANFTEMTSAMNKIYTGLAESQANPERSTGDQQEHSNFGTSRIMHALIAAEHEWSDQRPQLPAIEHEDHGVTILESVALAQMEMDVPAPGSLRQSYLEGRE
eukprot:1176097-Amphidinium_carterae.1